METEPIQIGIKHKKKAEEVAANSGNSIKQLQSDLHTLANDDDRWNNWASDDGVKSVWKDAGIDMP